VHQVGFIYKIMEMCNILITSSHLVSAVPQALLSNSYTLLFLKIRERISQACRTCVKYFMGNTLVFPT